MKIWLDNDYKCYITDNGTMRAIDTEYFDGFCQDRQSATNEYTPDF